LKDWNQCGRFLVRFDLHQVNQRESMSGWEQHISISGRSREMITTSELAATITIWILTISGAFFGGRAAWRRRNLRREEQRKPPTT
jgi:hypothetical protein